MQLFLAALLAAEASEDRASVHSSVSRVAGLLAVTANQVEGLTESRALIKREALLRSVHLIHVASGAVDYTRLRYPARVGALSWQGLLLVLVERSGARRASVLARVPLTDDVHLVLVRLLQLNIGLGERILA